MTPSSALCPLQGTMEGMKLYVVTRQDLSPGAQAVQCCHVLWQFAYEHPRLGHAWFTESNTLALLVTPDEGGLHKLAQTAHELAIRYSLFREPDYKNALTAVALEPSTKTKKLVSRLPLALNTRQK